MPDQTQAADPFGVALNSLAQQATNPGGDPFGDALAAKATEGTPDTSDTPSEYYPMQWADPKTGKVYYSHSPHTDTAPVDAVGVFAKNALDAVGYLPKKIISGYAGLTTFARTGDLDRAANTINDLNAPPQMTLSPSGQWAQDLIDNSLISIPGKIINKTGDLLERAGVQPDIAHAAPQAAGDIASLFGLKAGMEGAPEGTPGMAEPPTPVASEGLPAQYSARSGGAAAATPDISTASAPLQNEISTGLAQGKTINTEALERQLEADSIGINLRRGQATQDSVQSANEFNTRNENPAIANSNTLQNTALVKAVNDVKDNAAPTASTSATTNGQTVIDAGREILDPLRADARTKWNAVNDANGGNIMVDGRDFADAATAELKRVGKARYLPSALQGDLEDMSGHAVTATDVDNLMTNLSNEAYKAKVSGDGNAGLAVGALQRTLQGYDFPGMPAEYKAMLTDARAATKKYYDVQRANPGFEAIAADSTPKGNLSPLADTFIDKYVTRAPTAYAQQMAKDFAGSPDAMQAISGHLLNTLKAKAGINLDDDTGMFSNVGYNRMLTTIRPKLQSFLDPDSLAQVDKIGRVAYSVKNQPTGAAFNNSGTSVVAQTAKKIGSAVGEAAVAGADLIPYARLGTRGEKAVQSFKTRAWLKSTMKPGAGIFNEE